MGAPISSALLYLKGIAGLEGWQWLFVVEGTPAILLGVVCLFYLPNTPNDAKWLCENEKHVLMTMLEGEGLLLEGKDKGSVKQALRNTSMWPMVIASVGLNAGSYGLVFFLPLIISEFGASQLGTGLLTALPFIVAMIAMLFWGYHSDRTGERRWHIVLPTAAAAVGYLVAALTTAPLGKMMAVTIAAGGVYMAVALFWGFIPMFFERGRTAAAAIAIINMVGSLAGFFAPFAIGMLKDATGSYAGGLMFITVFVASGALSTWYMTKRLKKLGLVEEKTHNTLGLEMATDLIDCHAEDSDPRLVTPPRI
jgi:nitrate/nitrite transporter NarK